MKLNKDKRFALYLLWFFLHLILFLTSGNFLIRYDSEFFPFPIFKAKEVKTYHFHIYSEFTSNGYFLGKYEEYFRKIHDMERLKKLYSNYKDIPEIYFKADSITFMNNMTTSIEKYGNKKYYTKYGQLFPGGIKQYDYSEFIIYLLLPLVFFYFKKFWFSRL